MKLAGYLIVIVTIMIIGFSAYNGMKNTVNNYNEKQQKVINELMGNNNQ